MLPDGWVTASQAAAELGLSASYIGELAERGLLDVEVRDRRRLVSRVSLDALIHERVKWITLVEAGALIGVSSKTAQKMARRGLIHQRSTAGTKSPSISLASVESYLRGTHKRRSADDLF